MGSHYRLVRMLGEGMFGKVYVAQRIDVPEHQVALKLLPRALYQGRNVERELVMLATVGHPHVVQLKDHGTTPEYVWLTMPVYEGETLAERLARGPSPCAGRTTSSSRWRGGSRRCTRRGSGTRTSSRRTSSSPCSAGTCTPCSSISASRPSGTRSFVAGTALYGAPEQVTVLAGFVTLSPLSEKMDTYGLAATLLFALVGPKHFPGEQAQNRVELTAAQRVRTEEPIGPGALPELTGEARARVSAAFSRWLAEDPNARPSMKALAEQLDVLLEQEREEERLEERRRARQRATVLAQRIGIAAMLLLGAAGGAVVWSKRETLRVASELAAARRQGAESFDKLDTCSASYRMARAQVDACKARGAQDRAEYERSLEGLTQSGTATDAERAREVQRVNGRVKACEDGADKARRACDEELALKDGAASRLKTQLTEERDRGQAEVAAERSEAFAMQAERDVCRAERAVCEEERNTCRAEKARAPAVVPAHLPAPGSAAPVAPPPGAPEPAAEKEPKGAPRPAHAPVDAAARAPPPRAETAPAARRSEGALTGSKWASAILDPEGPQRRKGARAQGEARA